MSELSHHLRGRCWNIDVVNAAKELDRLEQRVADLEALVRLAHRDTGWHPVFANEWWWLSHEGTQVTPEQVALIESIVNGDAGNEAT